MTHDEALALFIASTSAMFESGQSLMQRVLCDDTGTADSWRHYPANDVVNGALQSRWFYHCHPPEERGRGEHGHFHIFLGKAAFGENAQPLIPAPVTDSPRADVVHVAALAIDLDGLPTGWFTVNRWVTDEWLYPAEDIAALIGQVDFRGEDGDPLVNDWLTAIFALQRDTVAGIVQQRDRRIVAEGIHGEDRDSEILSQAGLSLETLLG